jgi:hypothetical protein
MKHLHELALSKYQNHLNIIQHLYLLEAMTEEVYRESMISAARLWKSDIDMISLLETRKNFINEVA